MEHNLRDTGGENKKTSVLLDKCCEIREVWIGFSDGVTDV